MWSVRSLLPWIARRHSFPSATIGPDQSSRKCSENSLRGSGHELKAKKEPIEPPASAGLLGLPRKDQRLLHAGGLDVAIVGIPYAGANSHDASSPACGPAFLRQNPWPVGWLEDEAGYVSGGYDRTLDRALLDRVRVADLGDYTICVSADPQVREAYLSELERSYSDLLAMTEVIVAIGGDHSITAALTGALAARHDALTLIQYDAHSDVEFTAAPLAYSDLTHSNFVRHCLHTGHVHEVIQIGVRDFSLPPDLVDLPIRQPTTISMAEPGTGRPSAYLSIDMDVFDPGEFPDVTFPVPGGMQLTQFAHECERVARLYNIVGCDIVEYSPRSRLGAIFVQYVLATVLARLSRSP